MSHFFFNFDTLQEGASHMLQLIFETYKNMDKKKVSPDVQPGFLRRQLSQEPPLKGQSVEQVIKQTKQKIQPGIMHWQSPKYFGYFPSSIAATNIIADMFTTTFHSPAFNYYISPSHTQLENIQMDWCVKALGLPEDFLLKNSGGGIINNSTTESVFASIHAAKRTKMTQLMITETDPRILRFVGYFGQLAHNGAQRGLMMKQIPYKRSIRMVYDEQRHNYVLDIQHFKQLLSKDLAEGLIPFWFGATCGSTLCGSTDLTQQVIEICSKNKIWLNVDAAYLGSCWICPEMRLKPDLLQNVDSICINFSKAMLLGNGGSIMFVKNKQKYTEAFRGSTSKFSFYENKYSGANDVVDYKDWIVGLGRRNNSLKFFFLFKHYGLQNLRMMVREMTEKAGQIQLWLKKNEKYFEFFSREFGLVTFRCKDKKGNADDSLTQKVGQKVKNIQEGYLTPGEMRRQGKYLLRLAVGNPHASLETIKRYLQKIKDVTCEIQGEQKQ